MSRRSKVVIPKTVFCIAEPPPEDVEAGSKRDLEDGWDREGAEVAVDDPDEYIQAERHVSDGDAAVEDALEKDDEESSMSLPELTTESYEDDPEASLETFSSDT